MAIPSFSSIGAEISYWLSHIGKSFEGGYSGSGENGIDVTLPQDTPVYAVQGGTVAGAGYYAGGGVESIASGPGLVWYYQHLDQNLLTAGESVVPGQLIGYSGGQNVGGAHPASPTFSSWPHLEVGINAPWGGIWGGGSSVGPNVNPVPALQTLLGSTAGIAAGSTLAGGSGSGGCSNTTPVIGWIGTAFCNLGSGAQNLFTAILAVVERGGVILGGAVLIVLALIFLLKGS